MYLSKKISRMLLTAATLFAVMSSSAVFAADPVTDIPVLFCKSGTLIDNRSDADKTAHPITMDNIRLQYGTVYSREKSPADGGCEKIGTIKSDDTDSTFTINFAWKAKFNPSTTATSVVNQGTTPMTKAVFKDPAKYPFKVSFKWGVMKADQGQAILIKDVTVDPLGQWDL